MIGHFSAFALLLLTRDLGTTDGWSAIFKDGYRTFRDLQPVFFVMLNIYIRIVLLMILIYQMTSISTHNFRYVGSSVSAIMVAILLFIFPAYPFWKKAESKYDLEGWNLHIYFLKIQLNFNCVCHLSHYSLQQVITKKIVQEQTTNHCST